MNSRFLKSIALALLFYVGCFNQSFAANYLTLKYSAKAGDSLKSIFLYFLHSGIPPAEANKSIVLTMSKNPTVKVWNPLTNDTTFKLYIDPAIADLKRYNAYYVESKAREVHHLSVFTMPSIGFFSQANQTGFNVKYNQISFLSLGVGYQYSPFKYPFQMSASFYYSTISATTNQINGGAGTVDIPGEYGGNLYGLYKPDLSQLSYFGGLDFESFSSFNLANLIANDAITIDTNTVTYLTGGLNYKPKFLEKMSFKVSISKSIVTSSKSALANTTPAKISGMKFILFVNYQLTDKWSVITMLKSHSFSGDNDLSINRLGLGVSCSIF